MATTPELQLTWIAKLELGTEICQYDPSGKEHPFKEVLDNLPYVRYFYLIHKTKGLKIAVDLRQGLILFNDAPSPEQDLLLVKRNIRLIYFRRNKVALGGDGQTLGHEVTYFLGYQYQDKNGHNKKVLAQIDQNANIILGDN